RVLPGDVWFDAAVDGGAQRAVGLEGGVLPADRAGRERARRGGRLGEAACGDDVLRDRAAAGEQIEARRLRRRESEDEERVLLGRRRRIAEGFRRRLAPVLEVLRGRDDRAARAPREKQVVVLGGRRPGIPLQEGAELRPRGQ